MRGRELKDRPYFCDCGFQEGLLRVKVLVVGKRDIVSSTHCAGWPPKSQCLSAT